MSSGQSLSKKTTKSKPQKTTDIRDEMELDEDGETN